MLNISHAKKAQDLATETNYRTFLHEYTTLPSDMNVAWAKKAYGLQSDVSLVIRHSNRLKRSSHYRTVKSESSVFLYLETVQVRSELDEGRRLGGLKISGCPAGEESRGAPQRGNLKLLLTRMHCLNQLQVKRWHCNSVILIKTYMIKC